jgi:hypothetical protein
MAQIELFQPAHLPQMQTLVNAHLSTLAPGWALPEQFLASRLQRDPGEFVVDPWVTARVTLCAIERQRVVAAEDEAAGADRFYQRQGWQALVRLQRGWVLDSGTSTEQEGTEHAQHSR